MPEGTARDAALALGRRCNFEEGHALRDERLALRLFDETRRLGLHNGGQEQRSLLSLAAILHDIGYAAGYEEHHKTTFKLILAEPISGLPQPAQALVAHVARYHRGSLPDASKTRSVRSARTRGTAPGHRAGRHPAFCRRT